MPMFNDDGVTIRASKRKRRKGRGYIKGFLNWTGQHKTTKKRVARMSRRQAKKDLR